MGNLIELIPFALVLYFGAYMVLIVWLVDKLFRLDDDE